MLQGTFASFGFSAKRMLIFASTVPNQEETRMGVVCVCVCVGGGGGGGRLCIYIYTYTYIYVNDYRNQIPVSVCPSVLSHLP